MVDWFSYLKHLDVPGKLKISHSIIERLVQSDLDLVESEQDLAYDDIIDHGELTPHQVELEEAVKQISIKESAFQIAQIEYEKKEKRFLDKTNYSQQMLEQIYSTNDLVLKDIDDSQLLVAMEKRDWEGIVQEIGRMTVIIGADVDIFYSRIDLIMEQWISLSAELLEKIRSFEFRGMKVISTNLRVKLTPVLEEFKTELKDQLLKDESISRGRVEVELMEMVDRAREDLYGDLTGQQVALLDQINPDLTKDELIRLMKDEETRKNLAVLLETEKIEIRMKKVIDRLI